jgi:hypothetical protein
MLMLEFSFMLDTHSYYKDNSVYLRHKQTVVVHEAAKIVQQLSADKPCLNLMACDSQTKNSINPKIMRSL